MKPEETRSYERRGHEGRVRGRHEVKKKAEFRRADGTTAHVQS